MPELMPFAAIRYDFASTGGDLSDVVAPPYDVVDQNDKDALLARSANNIVSVDLPHVPPKSAGPPACYVEAAARFEQWLSDGVLVREATPAMYLYHQNFEHAGRSYTRKMFIARVRLTPFSDGSILPHEQTFGGPKEDRLALMQSTKCQLSALLGMYADPDHRVSNAFAATADRQADVTAMLNGVENRMWIVGDAAVVQSVVTTMAEKKVYIADGHHRYGTALQYRNWLTEQNGGELANDHPANYVMFVLASMDDPGCLILPYHRAIANVSSATVQEAWRNGTEPCDAGDADVVVWDGATGEGSPLRFCNRAIMATLEPDKGEAWRQLDYAYLHRYLIDELLTTGTGTTPDVRYVKSDENAKQIARDHNGVALLVNATPMAHLRAVSESNELMPQKSTYFHPKLATGLTINPLS